MRWSPAGTGLDALRPNADVPGSESEPGTRILRFSDQRVMVLIWAVAGLLFGRIDSPATVTPVPGVKVLTSSRMGSIAGAWACVVALVPDR